MMGKHILLTGAGVAISTVLLAQNIDTTLSYGRAAGQKKIFAEKIYARTDKNNYLAGELLWWKIYYTDGFYHRPANLSRVVYIELLDNQHRAVLQEKAALSPEGSNGSLFLPAVLRSGPYTFRAYTNWMKNFGEACFFTRQIFVVNALTNTVPSRKNAAGASPLARDSRHHLPVSLHTDTSQYSTRKQVNLTLKAGLSKLADLSVAVYRMDSSGTAPATEIENYLWSDDTQYPDSIRIKYLPEFDGHLISGDVRTSAGQPLANLTAYLSVPSAHGQFYPGQTDSLGRFRFDVRNYYGAGQLFIQAANNKLIDYTIRVNNPFFESARKDSQALTAKTSDTLNGLLVRQAIDLQVQNIFWARELGKASMPVVDSAPFFGHHYTAYRLDDYVRFSTLEEVLREYVPEVMVHRINRRLQLSVIDFTIKDYLRIPPLILLDGVAVSDEKILSYDPLKIKTLRVVTTNYHFGTFLYGGVISFTTYGSAADELTIDPKDIVMAYDGLQVPPVFFSPDYTTAANTASRIPDFRRLLYWAPDVKTDSLGTAHITFFTSDLPGKYVAVAEGMDGDGAAGGGSCIFEVVR